MIFDYKNILNEQQIEKLESLISKDQYYFVLYARDIVKGSWEKAKITI